MFCRYELADNLLQEIALPKDMAALKGALDLLRRYELVSQTVMDTSESQVDEALEITGAAGTFMPRNLQVKLHLLCTWCTWCCISCIEIGLALPGMIAAMNSDRVAARVEGRC